MSVCHYYKKNKNKKRKTTSLHVNLPPGGAIVVRRSDFPGAPRSATFDPRFNATPCVLQLLTESDGETGQLLPENTNKSNKCDSRQVVVPPFYLRHQI